MLDMDPRRWTLALGVALASGLGCGAGSTGVGQSESTSESEETRSTEASDSSGSSGSSDSSDSSDDGCACTIDDDCGLFQICSSCACVEVGSAPGPCGAMIPAPELREGGEPYIALAFADLDLDGAQELVITGDDTFSIYTHGSDVPLVVARANPSFPGWVGAGAFDLDPGEDLLVSGPGGLSLYSSDGMGGISDMPTLIPLLAGGRALKRGDIDGQAPEDLLETTDSGAFELLGSGEIVELTPEPSLRAALIDRTHAQTGIAIDHGAYLSRFELDGTPLGVTELESEWLVAASLGDDSYFLSAEPRASGAWYWLRWIEAATGVIAFEHAFATTEVEGAPNFIQWYAADLDGDGRDDEVLVPWLAAWGVSLWDGAPGGCLLDTDLSLDVELFDVAVGDHDGDGDEEFAVVVASGEVAILDYEG